MGTFILYLYAITAMHGTQYGTVTDRAASWQYAGTFQNERACKNATLILGMDPSKARCVPTY